MAMIHQYTASCAIYFPGGILVLLCCHCFIFVSSSLLGLNPPIFLKKMWDEPTLMVETTSSHDLTAVFFVGIVFLSAPIVACFLSMLHVCMLRDSSARKHTQLPQLNISLQPEFQFMS